MKIRKILTQWWHTLITITGVTLLIMITTLGFGQTGWALPFEQPFNTMTLAGLAQGDAITDPNAILRYALPIDNQAVRELQADLEDIAKHIRGKRWNFISKDVRGAARILSIRSDEILDAVPEASKPEAETLLAQITEGVSALQEVVETQDKEAIWTQRKAILKNLTNLEELMVAGFPLEIPTEYANLPQLKGRATVLMKTTKGDLTIVVDGYSAPVNGGNFVDLVQRGFYDGLDFIRDEDLYIIQSGDPKGADEGFIDPKTGEYRAIPLEILIKGEKTPIYGITLEEAGIYLPNLALPFNAYGAIALARPSDDANGGSSQFFFFKFDNELTPPGFNVMDGRYSVFGYVVDGKDVLEQLTKEDKIISAKVISGGDNLVQPQA